MIVGGYTLDLYCDHPQHDQLPHLPGCNPRAMPHGQFTGDNGKACRSYATRSGWLLRGDKATCPRCRTEWTTDSPAVARALASLRKGPQPRQTFNPGIAALLVRTKRARVIQAPNPYAHSSLPGMIEHLALPET